MIHSEGPLVVVDVEERETNAENVDDVLASFVGDIGVGTKPAHDRIPFDADSTGRFRFPPNRRDRR